MREHKGKIIITLGIISLVSLLLLYSFFSRVLYDTFPQLEENTTAETNNAEQVRDYVNDDSVEQDYDPFVTVVPKDVAGGKPHPLPTDPQRGTLTPKVTIIEFGDFECGNCAQMDEVVDRIVEEYPDTVNHVWKDYPLPQVHQNSDIAAYAARCAQNQGKFWEYHDALLEQQDTFAIQPWSDIAQQLGLDTATFDQCMQSGETQDAVVKGYFAAKTLDIQETPAYYINDQYHTGLMSYEEFKSIVDEEIQNSETAK